MNITSMQERPQKSFFFNFPLFWGPTVAGDLCLCGPGYMLQPLTMGRRSYENFWFCITATH